VYLGFCRIGFHVNNLDQGGSEDPSRYHGRVRGNGGVFWYWNVGVDEDGIVLGSNGTIGNVSVVWNEEGEEVLVKMSDDY
jgi:hypothetical protein